MIFFRRVTGKSMEPTLRDGQIVWVHGMRNFREGNVVVAFVNGREVIKRIKKIKDGRVYLEGDNKNHSTDSKDYGTIVDTKIDGIVFWPRVSK